MQSNTNNQEAKALAAYSDPKIAHAMAIASSRIEGVEPGQKSIGEVNKVITGEITGDQLRAKWIGEIKARQQ
jgi:Antitoxin VbhA